MPIAACSHPDCERVSKTVRGLCHKHYMRLVRTGSSFTVRPPGIPGNSRKHFMYGSWAGMVNRCHNPNNSAFARYGGIGTAVCDRWRHGENGLTGFECFLSDVGERPAGMTLDRIDPHGNYERDNCRWATIKEQRNNIRPEAVERMRLEGSKRMKAYWERRRAASALEV